MAPRHRFAVIFPVAYLIVVLAALIFLVTTARQTAFAGLWAFVVTLPWSALLFALLDDMRREVFDDSIWPGVLLIMFSAAINTLICNAVGRFIDDGRPRRA